MGTSVFSDSFTFQRLLRRRRRQEDWEFLLRLNEGCILQNCRHWWNNFNHHVEAKILLHAISSDIVGRCAMQWSLFFYSAFCKHLDCVFSDLSNVVMVHSLAWDVCLFWPRAVSSWEYKDVCRKIDRAQLFTEGVGMDRLVQETDVLETW